MIRLVLPKGSLENATLDLFRDADLAVNRDSDVSYRARIKDPRIDDVHILRPQEIPSYIEEGLFDLGITGRDWIEETQSDVVSVGELEYSKNTSNPIRVVLAVDGSSSAQSVNDLSDGVRVATEFPGITRRYFEQHGITADVRLSYGATEAKVPEIADAVVEITETGRALRASGLRILETVLVSKTELIANRETFSNPQKRHAIEQIYVLLLGALQARGCVLLKVNVPEQYLDDVISLIPGMKSPTVSKLWNNNGYAIEGVVEKNGINTLISELKDAGATDIIELPLRKIIP